MRNYWNNGLHRIAQRGTSVIPVASGYTLDQHIFTTSGGVHVISQQPFTVGQEDVPGNPQFYLQWELPATPPATSHSLGQRIPRVDRFSGNLVMWHSYICADRALPIRVQRVKHYGSGGGVTTSETDILIEYTLTTEWLPMLVTETLPYMGAPIVIGSEPRLEYRINVLSTELATAAVIKWANIFLGVEGDVGEDEGVELDWLRCKSYFERKGGSIATTVLGTGRAETATRAFVLLPYTDKRKTPTITVNGTVATHFELRRQGGGVIAADTITLVAGMATQNSCLLQVDVAAGLVPGEQVDLRTNNVAGSIDISAEI